MPRTGAACGPPSRRSAASARPRERRKWTRSAGSSARRSGRSTMLPFDFRHTTRIAMGVNWRRATPEQQEQLTREFRALLVRTYSGALAGYSDQVIEFRPLRAQPGDTEVTVRSQVRRSGAEPIGIEYDLERTGPAWKVFDIRVAGISLAATYRSAFAEEVRNHGIDGLISLLSSKNRAAVKPVSVKT